MFNGRRSSPPRVAAAAGAGYLLGTVPSADVAARLATGGATDLRAAGSGNPGAANAIAALGKVWGSTVLAADMAKGALACVVGGRLAGAAGANLAGTAAVVGHCWPVWNGFRGGKGVAVSSGQCLATFPAYFPVDLVVALVAARVRKRAFPATVVASAAWVGSGLLWWRRRWPNAWGPVPGPTLPLSAAATSVVIASRFAAADRRARQAVT
ncbi:MAG TPA: glycerol-3-phosphate acyltransferase [Acidimicrobiales bacterium]|nr:glycerol-3-phosphate acyltransferase [Acidimicrobiales bacterium]